MLQGFLINTPLEEGNRLQPSAGFNKLFEDKVPNLVWNKDDVLAKLKDRLVLVLRCKCVNVA